MTVVNTHIEFCRSTFNNNAVVPLRVTIKYIVYELKTAISVYLHFDKPSLMSRKDVSFFRLRRKCFDWPSHDGDCLESKCIYDKFREIAIVQDFDSFQGGLGLLTVK